MVKYIFYYKGGDKVEYRNADVEIGSLTSLGEDVFWAGAFSKKLHWSNKVNAHNKIVRFLMIGKFFFIRQT